MNYISSDERLARLAKELQKVLSDCVSGNSVATDEQVEKTLKLKREITMMGVLVKCEYILDVKNERVSAVMTLYKVKENLSPEDRKIYDDWFMEINGLKI